LSDHLAAIGEVVSDVHKVAVLLRKVQDSYSTLVTALLARGDNELTLMFVKQALVDEEQRRGGQPGHFARDCPKHKPKSTKGHHPAKSNGTFVTTMGLKVDTQSDEWIIDSTHDLSD